VIRGGVEPHGAEVLANARQHGLTVVDVKPPREVGPAIEFFTALPPADVYNVAAFMSDELISLFYSASDAVLANSGHEPFGLVGLEVMAAGGVAFVGSTGEDYAVPFMNAVVLDTDDPAEIGIALDFLRTHPGVAARLRSDGQETARSFSWQNVILDTLIGKLEYVARRQLVNPPAMAAAPVAARAETDAVKAATGLGAAATAATPASDPAGAGSTGADPQATSPAYGGQSVPTKLSVKPQTTHKPAE